MWEMYHCQFYSKYLESYLLATSATDTSEQWAMQKMTSHNNSHCCNLLCNSACTNALNHSSNLCLSLYSYRSVPQIRPPFATLALVQNAGGAYTRDHSSNLCLSLCNYNFSRSYCTFGQWWGLSSGTFKSQRRTRDVWVCHFKAMSEFVTFKARKMKYPFLVPSPNPNCNTKS